MNNKLHERVFRRAHRRSRGRERERDRGTKTTHDYLNFACKCICLAVCYNSHFTMLLSAGGRITEEANSCADSSHVMGDGWRCWGQAWKPFSQFIENVTPAECRQTDSSIRYEIIRAPANQCDGCQILADFGFFCLIFNSLDGLRAWP